MKMRREIWPRIFRSEEGDGLEICLSMILRLITR